MNQMCEPNPRTTFLSLLNSYLKERLMFQLLRNDVNRFTSTLHCYKCELMNKIFTIDAVMLD